MDKKVIIHFTWEGMDGSVCNRLNNELICDFHGKMNNSNCYCRDFFPKYSLSKRKIFDMLRKHCQRFIRERQL